MILSLSLSSFIEASKKPNVILIYGDDVGYGDLGVLGAKKIPTPNLDKLAAQGLVFTDGHSPAATCSASRFTMLTGQLAHRKKIRILGISAPLSISLEDYTLAHVFQDAGYKTAVIGKWHLGLGTPGVKTDWNGIVKPGPLEIGFDYSFLLPNTNDRVPCVYLENHQVVNLDPNDPIYLSKKVDPRSTEYPNGRTHPEAMTYYPNSHGHNHSVINGIGRIGTMYGGTQALWNDETMADEFVIRTEMFITSHLKENKEQPFFLYFSSQDIHVPRVPHPRFRGKSELGYRGDAMVQLDWSTGAIMNILKNHGIDQNTMILFSSDNGPVYDDGYKDGTTVKTSREEVDNGHDGSGIYRGGKYQIYEGGTRVPFIVSWPEKIKPGFSDALVTQTDFIRSFAKMLNINLPQNAAPDSQNTIKAFLGEDPIGNTYMIEEAKGYALRHQNWKLIRMGTKGAKKNQQSTPIAAEPPKYQLFNLENDVGEQKNVFAQYPEKAEVMIQILEEIFSGAGAYKVFQNLAL